ncbi:MAG TPA: aldo/keto reductase [Gemmatimonadaceae bacterium]|nr:aldo/keto reductase [Gemmatimonadaceae bacterium]
MTRSTQLDMHIEGRATAEGTRRYAARFAKTLAPDFYRPLAGLSHVSSLGLGTYLGDCDDAEDARYTATTVAALERGVNLIDTAINYRCQRSERAIGDAIRILLQKGDIKRDEFVVCTKGGYIPLDRTPPATREGYRGFLQSEYFGPGIITADEVVSGGHCLSPRYLADQIDRSKRNLRLAFLDIYYLHNPEQQLDSLDREAFARNMRAAFSELEKQVSRGNIGCYGCATWNGFRIDPGARNHLSLEQLTSIAVEVAGRDHHFKAIQLPINLAMPEAVRGQTQTIGASRTSVIEAAHTLNVSVVGSATLMQSQLAQSLPDQIRQAFPGFSTDARRATAFAQSLPISAALVGMKSVSHLEQNLERPAVS